MRKSIISLFLILIMAFGAAGCTAPSGDAGLPAGAVIGGSDGLTGGSAAAADTGSQTESEVLFMNDGKTD